MKQFDITDPKYINHQRKELQFTRYSSLIIKDVKSIQKFIPTVSGTQLTKDGLQLVVFVNFTYSEKKALELLNNAKGFFRTELANSTNAKHVPQIIFKIDKSTDNGIKIEEILKQLKEEGNE